MAFDVSASLTHNIFFPSKLLASMGGKHQFDITTTAAHDNGVLVNRGSYLSFDNYQEASVASSNSFEGLILGADDTNDDQWYVEVTADTDLVVLYNSPVSPYGEERFQNEASFYNASGDVVRAYGLAKGDIFSISKSAFTGTPTAGKTLTFVSGKYVVGD